MKAAYPIATASYITPPGSDKLRVNLARTVSREHVVKMRNHIRDQVGKAKEKELKAKGLLRAPTPTRAPLDGTADKPSGSPTVTSGGVALGVPGSTRKDPPMENANAHIIPFMKSMIPGAEPSAIAQAERFMATALILGGLMKFKSTKGKACTGENWMGCVKVCWDKLWQTHGLEHDDSADHGLDDIFGDDPYEEQDEAEMYVDPEVLKQWGVLSNSLKNVKNLLMQKDVSVF